MDSSWLETLLNGAKASDDASDMKIAAIITERSEKMELLKAIGAFVLLAVFIGCFALKIRHLKSLKEPHRKLKWWLWW